MIHFIRTYGNFEVLIGPPLLLLGVISGSEITVLLGVMTTTSRGMHNAWHAAMGNRLPGREGKARLLRWIELFHTPLLALALGWVYFSLEIALVAGGAFLLIALVRSHRRTPSPLRGTTGNRHVPQAGSLLGHFFRSRRRTSIALLLLPWSYIVGIFAPRAFPVLLLVSWSLRFVLLLAAIPRAHLLPAHWRGRRAVFRRDSLNIAFVSLLYVSGGALDALAGQLLRQGGVGFEASLWMLLATMIGLQLACILKLTSYRHVQTIRAILTLVIGVPLFVLAVVFMASHGAPVAFVVAALLLIAPWFALRAASSRDKDMLPLFSGQPG